MRSVRSSAAVASPGGTRVVPQPYGAQQRKAGRGDQATGAAQGFEHAMQRAARLPAQTLRVQIATCCFSELKNCNGRVLQRLLSACNLLVTASQPTTC